MHGPLKFAKEVPGPLKIVFTMSKMRILLPRSSHPIVLAGVKLRFRAVLADLSTKFWKVAVKP